MPPVNASPPPLRRADALLVGLGVRSLLLTFFHVTEPRGQVGWKYQKSKDLPPVVGPPWSGKIKSKDLTPMGLKVSGVRLAKLRTSVAGAEFHIPHRVPPLESPESVWAPRGGDRTWKHWSEPIGLSLQLCKPDTGAPDTGAPYVLNAGLLIVDCGQFNYIISHS
jgi:hypothetical protein